MYFVFYLERYLHSNYGIYEEKHSNEKTDVRKSLLEKRQQRQIIQTCHGGKKYKFVILPEKKTGIILVWGMKKRSEKIVKMSDLERLHEGPQQYTDGVTLPQQLDQPGRSEKLQETHVDGVHRLGQTHRRLERGWHKMEGRRARAADRRERQDVKHRWWNSSQYD